MLLKMILGGKSRSAPYQTHQMENLRGTVGASDMDALRVPTPKQSVLKMLYKVELAPALNVTSRRGRSYMQLGLVLTKPGLGLMNRLILHQCTLVK